MSPSIFMKRNTYITYLQSYNITYRVNVLADRMLEIVLGMIPMYV